MTEAKKELGAQADEASKFCLKCGDERMTAKIAEFIPHPYRRYLACAPAPRLP